MEGIAETAVAYYRRLSPAHQQRAYDLFRSIDGNGDGAITFNEYSNYCRAQGYQQPTRRFFEMFDKNGDGLMDYSEFLSLYYLTATGRFITCDGCREFLLGVYFTCSVCFHAQIATYNLCPNCFRDNCYAHHHPADAFIDSHALLLLTRRKVLDIKRYYQAPPAHHHYYHHHYPQPQHPGNDTVGVGEIIQGLSLGYHVASLCNIM